MFGSQPKGTAGLYPNVSSYRHPSYILDYILVEKKVKVWSNK